MRERIFQAKKAASPVSISTLKQPTRGFGLESLNASPPAMTQVQSLNKPLSHDISKISLRPQAKLSISQPGDAYEQEADTVARQVIQRMALSGNRQSIQRQEAPEEEEELQMKPLDISTLQRQEVPEEEEELQMKPLDISTLQRQEVPEEEEELQMKPLDISTLQRQEVPQEEEELQMKPLDISTIQRQEAPEEEEELQMKPLDISTLQRQEVPEEEEELQMKPLDISTLQRQEAPEEKEELQMKSLDISTIQRQEVPEEEEELQMKPLDISTIQRQEAPEEEEELQMKPMVQRQTNGGMAATGDLETSINQARGGGQPLGDNIREPMEQAFGADFGGVKVHTDSQSHELNQSIQARAFTTGQDIFFRQGEYNPGSQGGQELLAHELTHVVQQSGGAINSEDKRGKKLINLVENTGHERVSPTKGKDGQQPEKSKGDDYANNVQKLLNDLNKLLPGFINEEINEALRIINENRAKCSVSTSQVTGEDTNTLAYGNLKNRIVGEVTSKNYLLEETDRKHFIEEARKLVAVLISMIDEIPTTAVDSRVAEVIESEGKPDTQEAMKSIDAALIKLSKEMKKRLIEYFKTIFDKNFISKKDNDPKEPPPGGGTGGGILVN
jgi:hypothetical protein